MNLIKKVYKVNSFTTTTSRNMHRPYRISECRELGCAVSLIYSLRLAELSHAPA